MISNTKNEKNLSELFDISINRHNIQLSANKFINLFTLSILEILS